MMSIRNVEKSPCTKSSLLNGNSSDSVLCEKYKPVMRVMDDESDKNGGNELSCAKFWWITTTVISISFIRPPNIVVGGLRFTAILSIFSFFR